MAAQSITSADTSRKDRGEPPTPERFVLYVISIGASSTGANLVKVASAAIAPRATGRASTSSVATSSIATSVSLEFDSRAKAVYG